LTISGANTVVTMSGLTSGPNAGMVVWMPRTNATTTLTLNGNTTVNQYDGSIYVPNVDVTLAGSAGIQIGSIICRTLSYSGGQAAHIGPYTPSVGAPNPTSGPPGSSASITGTGFVANSPITITVGTATATVTAGATTDANGDVTATFTVPAVSPGDYPVSVTDGLGNTATSGTQLTVETPPSLVFTSAAVSGAASSTANLGPITVQMRDAGNNPVNAPAGGTLVTLSSNSTGTAVFSATAGGAALTQVTIPAGSSSASFFYGDTKAGTPTLTAAAGGVTSGTQQETVLPDTLAGLRYVTNGTGSVASCPTGTVTVGNGGSLTTFVAEVDQFGNPVANGGSPATVSITRSPTSGGGNAPVPVSLTINAGANPAVTSGSSLFKLPSGNPAATTYTAAVGSLSTSCVVKK
jgi:hypothetical protein